MPTCDRPEFVPIAVASFLSQDFTDSELLIIDDGEEPVLHLIPKGELFVRRIRYIRAAKMNTGQKRNFAAQHAEGEIIVHWDDDDWSAPTRVSQQVARLEASGKFVTGCNSIVFYDKRDGNCYRYRGGNAYTLGTSQAYRRDWWTSHRFPESQIGEDTAFGHQAHRLNQLDVCDGVEMIVAVVHGKNTSPKPLNSTIYAPVAQTCVPEGFWKAYGRS